jgi:hypothetical protein
LIFKNVEYVENVNILSNFFGRKIKNLLEQSEIFVEHGIFKIEL